MDVALSPARVSHPSQTPLHARTSGAGEVVVCLHSSVGSHAQWRALSGELETRCRVVTPDLHGHGRSPAWPEGAGNTLGIDAHAASRLIPNADKDFAPDGVHLVGHSYGGAVALQMALHSPHRVLSLTLYEPVPFGQLMASAPHAPATREIEDIRHSVAALVRAGDLEGAARVFVVYWGGATAWEGMTAGQRLAVLERIPTVPRHFDALFQATWSAELLQSLTMPVLLLHGSNTRAPARAVADRLAASLAQAERVEIAGAGHLGPITHSNAVNAAIVTHLWRQWAFRTPPHAKQLMKTSLGHFSSLMESWAARPPRADFRACSSPAARNTRSAAPSPGNGS